MQDRKRVIKMRTRTQQEKLWAQTFLYFKVVVTGLDGTIRAGRRYRPPITGGYTLSSPAMFKANIELIIFTYTSRTALLLARQHRTVVF